MQGKYNPIFQRFFKRIEAFLRSVKNDRFRNWLVLNIPFWIAAGVTGAIAVIYQKLFAYMEGWSWQIISYDRRLVFILTPLCFVVSWWLVRKCSPNAKGSGIPQVMASLNLAQQNQHKLIKYLLSLKVIVVKILGSMIKVLGGGVAGREGPTIQIGASVFVWINELLPKGIPKISTQNAILAGAASGLAAAFNTPLGGLVFAIEELAKTSVKYFMTALFTAVIISGIVAQLLGDAYLYLGFPKLAGVKYTSLFAVFLVAIVCGILGSLLVKTILYLSKVYKANRSIWGKLFFVVCCSLVVSTSIFFFGQDAMGSGKEMMDTILFTDNKAVEWYTPILRSTGLIASFSSGGAGGVFAPSLSAGASVGSVIAHWLNYNQATSNLLILCGMIAFLTGVTRSPMTSAIIVLEMTDRHSSIFYFMLAGIVANIVSNMIDRKSFYEHLSHQYLNATIKYNKNKTTGR